VINLDTSEAGEGRITCRIGSNVESDVDIDIIDNGDGTISVMYTPRKPGAYTLEIKFGGQTIPNGTFTQQVQTPIPPTNTVLFSGFAQYVFSSSFVFQRLAYSSPVMLNFWIRN